MSSKKTRKEQSTQVQTQALDPRMDSMLYGKPSNPYTIGNGVGLAPGSIPGVGSYPGADSTGGLFGAASNLFNQGPQQFFPGPTYAGLNPTQRGALGGTVNYLSSPESMGGYRAMNDVGSQLVGRLGSSGQIQPPSVAAPSVSGSAGAVPDYLARMLGRDTPQLESTPGATAGSVSVQQGENPWLKQMLGDLRTNTIGDFNRSVAPMARGSAQLAGGFGGSRQGVVEANAMNDLGRNLGSAQTSLLGNVYESDANRRLSAESTNAQLGTQASLANAQMAADRARTQALLEMQGRGLDLQTAGQMADYSLGSGQLRQAGDIAGGNLALGAAGLNQRGLLDAGQLNLARDQASVGNALTGAGLLQDASRIPMQNLAGIMGAGGAYQADTQGMLDAARERWDFGQSAPWQNLARYQQVLQPNTTLGQTLTGNTNSTITERDRKGLYDWMKLLKPGD